MSAEPSPRHIVFDDTSVALDYRQRSRLAAFMAEAWEQGHFYCAAEDGDKRCRNPYHETSPQEHRTCVHDSHIEHLRQRACYSSRTSSRLYSGPDVGSSRWSGLAVSEAGYRSGRADVMDQVAGALEAVMADYRTPQGQVQIDYHEQESFVSEVGSAILAALEATS